MCTWRRKSTTQVYNLDVSSQLSTHLGVSGEKVFSFRTMPSGERAGRRFWVLSMIHVLQLQCEHTVASSHQVKQCLLSRQALRQCMLHAVGRIVRRLHANKWV